MTGATDPRTLLAWMRHRGVETIAARQISDAGPRAFRRRVAADAALAALIDLGAITEVGSRPRTFRVIESTPSPDEIRTRLQADLADRSDLPPDAKVYIAAADLKAALVRQLGHHCVGCEEMGRKVDDLVMAALGCEPGDDLVTDAKVLSHRGTKPPHTEPTH